jgi:hypothetical protein
MIVVHDGTGVDLNTEDHKAQNYVWTNLNFGMKGYVGG